MRAVRICPTCSMPSAGGICRRCAFTAALDGLAADSADPVPPQSSRFAGPAGYELRRELGAGATAVVWLARELKLDRLVALKFISAPTDRRLTHRLIREGQAAARLRHPHIVAIHALGTTGSHAYLAMDFVEGGDLRQRLARGRPTPREAAGLVEKLAGALAHAHENGVLHRDIKPSNVLLDPQGEPQLADFGLAAPLEGGGDLTLPGQVAGTAAYLAPELLGGADRASPQSDIYGLGALLYECLTARPPFLGDCAAAIFAQLPRDDPPAPRLFHPAIPRDLETICLKCLEKTPGHRYASAAQLADDLGRFRRGEIISARPVGFFGRTARWCGRNRLAAAYGGVAALLVLGLAIGGPAVALRLAHAKARAAIEAAASKAVSDFLRNDLLAQASPDRQPDRDLKLRTVLDRAAKNIDGRFPHQPLVDADIRETLASTYVSLGEYGSARDQWERVRNLRQHVLGPEDPKTLNAAANLFYTLQATGQYHEAEVLALEVIRTERRVLGLDHPETLAASNRLGTIYWRQGKLTEAEALYRDLLPRDRRVFGPEHKDTLWVMNNLALVYQEEGKFSAAKALHAERLAICRRTLGPTNPYTLTSIYNLGLTCRDTGDIDEAGVLFQEAIEARSRVLGPEHPDTLHALRAMAWIDQDLGKFDLARKLYRKVLAIQERKLGAEHPDTLVTRCDLGRLYRDEGKLADAESLVADCVAVRERVLGSRNHFTLQAKTFLAGIYLDENRIFEAHQLEADTLAQCERVFAPNHPRTVMARAEFGRILLAEKKFAEAVPVLERALAGLPKTAGTACRVAFVQSQLGRALLELKRYAEAGPLLLQSQETLARYPSRIPPVRRSEIEATAVALARLRAEWNMPGGLPSGPPTIADTGTRL